MYHNYTLWWIFWKATVILLILTLDNRWRKKNKDGESPLEILQKKFARVKITKEEYEEKRGILERDVSKDQGM